MNSSQNICLVGRIDGHIRSLSCVSTLFLIAIAVKLVGTSATQAETLELLFERIDAIETPAGRNAHEPFVVAHDEKLYLSWMEERYGINHVLMSILDDGFWTIPTVVSKGAELFVNWADFPSIAVFPDGTIAVHTLVMTGSSSFDYQVEVTLSKDEGRSWSIPIIPHVDRSLTQHGFVTMLPADENSMSLIWLDGRAYGDNASIERSEPDAMQLRATTLTSNGVLGEDDVVDLQTCSCCQTSLTKAGNGTLLAAYRDRTDDEIRDISVARHTPEGWQQPTAVHADGWELPGCPVNGPAISAAGDVAVVAWFTGANDIARVNVAFSKDTGRSFEAPTRIDLGEPMGRVDVEMLEDGTALVAWVEWVGDNEALVLCRVENGRGCTAREVLAINTEAASVNFPKMVRQGREVYMVWTQPDGFGDRLAMRRATLAKYGK